MVPRGRRRRQRLRTVANGKSAYELAVADGFQGSYGEWKQSLKGADGSNGSNGSNGVNGHDGSNGKDGNQGAKGDTGINGTDGAQGPQGPQGPQGKDAFQVAQANDPTITSYGQWKQSLKGDKGADGNQGPQGATGPQGPTPSVTVVNQDTTDLSSTVDVTCPADHPIAIGGGGMTDDGTITDNTPVMDGSHPGKAKGWHIKDTGKTTGQGHHHKVYAICSTDS